MTHNTAGRVATPPPVPGTRTVSSSDARMLVAWTYRGEWFAFKKASRTLRNVVLNANRCGSC